MSIVHGKEMGSLDGSWKTCNEKLALFDTGIDNVLKKMATSKIKAAEILTDCSSKIAEIKEKKEKTEKAIADMELKIYENNNKITTAQEKIDSYHLKKRLLEAEIKKCEKVYSEKKRDIEEKEMHLNSKVEILQTSLAAHSNHLGLQFKRLTDGMLRFIFISIDPKNPNKAFGFDMTVNNTFTVKNCSHPIADLDFLVNQLNSSNNLRKFIVEVRRRFRNYAEQPE